MRTYVNLSGQSLINTDHVHEISKQDFVERLSVGETSYRYTIKFTFADNRVKVWDYVGIGSVSGAAAQDKRDDDYRLLCRYLNILE